MINPFGFIATILYFKFAQKLKNIPYLGKFLSKIPPVVIAGILLIFTLDIFNIDYKKYNESANLITLMLIPATIALGYPIYKNIEILKKNKRIIYLSFLVATIVGIISTYIIGTILKANPNIILSMLPKSTTAPIAMEIAKQIGGVPELCVCVVVLTGIFGSLFGHKLLEIFKVKNNIAIGLSIGAASHVIGTSKCIEKGNEKQIASASIAIVMIGVLTAILTPLFLLILN